MRGKPLVPYYSSFDYFLDIFLAVEKMVFSGKHLYLSLFLVTRVNFYSHMVACAGFFFPLFLLCFNQSHHTLPSLHGALFQNAELQYWRNFQSIQVNLDFSLYSGLSREKAMRILVKIFTFSIYNILFFLCISFGLYPLNSLDYFRFCSLSWNVLFGDTPEPWKTSAFGYIYTNLCSLT